MAARPEKIKFLYLSQQDVLDVGLTMADVIELCTESFHEHGTGEVENPPKPGVHPQPDAFIHAMPAWVKQKQVSGIKWVSGFPSNIPKKMPTIVGVIILNDCETGFPSAVLDGTYITAIRTGAASGVTAKYFARQDSEVLSVIGTGVQGKYNTLCMLHLLPKLKTIKIYDTYAPSLQSFQDQIGPFLGENVKMVTVSNYEEAVRDSDVIVAATAMLNEPILFDDWVKPGALVLAIQRHGWNRDVLTKFDKVVVDDWDQFATLIKAKGCYEPFPDAPYAELGEVVLGKKTGRANDQERIINFNCGLGIHDMIVAAKVVEKAKEKGLGVELDLIDLTKPLPLPKIS